VLTQEAQSFRDECEVDEADKHNVELFESRENASEAFEPPKEALDLVAAFVKRSIVLPRFDPINFRWNDGSKSEKKRQFSRFVSLVGPIHENRCRQIGLAKREHQLPSLGRIMSVAWRERKR
jgi:hypothetical protein